MRVIALIDCVNSRRIDKTTGRWRLTVTNLNNQVQARQWRKCGDQLGGFDQFIQVDVVCLRTSRRMRRNDKNLAGTNMARFGVQTVNAEPALAFEDDEFTPAFRMVFHHRGEPGNRGSRHRSVDLNRPGLLRRIHQDRATSEIVRLRIGADVEYRVRAKARDGLVDES